MQTERLELRPLTSEHAEACNAYQSLPEVTTYIYWEPRTLEQTEQWIGRATNGTNGDNFVIVRKDTGEIIGDIGVWPVGEPEHNNGECGYVFHPHHHGHGFATEAMAELVRFAFEVKEYHRLSARLDARNVASENLLKRLGLRREAHFVKNEFVKGEWTDELVYALLKEEYQPSVERPSVPS